MEDAREGGDITAADMIIPPEEPSEIQKFYADSTIFITGGTGFLGRVFIEKLLRTCQDLKLIYVLIRTKKGKDENKRFEEFFDGPVFDTIKRKWPQNLNKVKMITGDLMQPDLGISDENKELLSKEVNVVFHCAATVRFDEKIRVATNINVRSTRDLIHLAKHMKNLKAMIHVSTAFSFCTRTNIDEELYDPPLDGQKLIALTEMFDDEQLDKMTPTLLGEYPNTYVFTKAIAENIVKTESKNLPVAVFRPAIVVSSVKEPVAGWIDNLYGATGILVGAALGVLRALHARPESTADIVPVDYVVNSAIAAAWEVASNKTINDNEETSKTTKNNKFEEEIPVYNYVSSPEAKLDWAGFMKLGEKHGPEVPTELLVWHYWFVMRKSLWAYKLSRFFYETIPAYIVDFLCMCIGKKPMMVKGYQKIHKFSHVLAYFTLREWKYTNKNVQNLWKKMNKTDQKNFEFSMKNFDWDDYFHTYIRGGRCYLLKDPLETIPKGKVKYYKLMVAHYTLLTVLALIFIKFLMWVFGLFF